MKRITIGDYVRESGFGSFVEGRGLVVATIAGGDGVVPRTKLYERHAEEAGQIESDFYAGVSVSSLPVKDGNVRGPNLFTKRGARHPLGFTQSTELCAMPFVRH